MELGVRDSARLLNVSEKTIYRWIKQGKLPVCRINDQYRFNRAELLEWAASQRLNVSPEIFHEPANGFTPVGLSQSLSEGGIYYRVEGTSKEAVLRSAVVLMPIPEQVDREFLFQLLLARESLGSTAVGKGIAIPHVRSPVVMHVSRPMITLAFLDHPVEFGALDGQPVRILFTLLSPSVRAHLHVLARLSFALQQEEFAAVIEGQGSREEILLACEKIDGRISSLATDGSARLSTCGFLARALA